LRKEFWDGRNKPILLIQWGLVIFATILYFQYDSMDYFYSGTLILIEGIITFLIGIENYIVKKREYIFWFILSVMFEGIGIDILIN